MHGCMTLTKVKGKLEVNHNTKPPFKDKMSDVNNVDIDRPKHFHRLGKGDNPLTLHQHETW